MSTPHLVRIGLMATVTPCRSTGFELYPPKAKVICRTARGLEYGQVICELDDEPEAGPPRFYPTGWGAILRQVTRDDQLILDRLQRHRDKAFFACEQRIRDSGIPAILVDVEHLFDGESVFFYFLGDVPPELESLTEELAALYETKVRFKKFAETLAQGCGPDCGSKEGGCSSSGCASCKLSGSCSSR